MSFDHVRAVFELLYFISGMVLAVIGFLALYHIILAKRVIIQSQESLRISAESLSLAKADLEIRNTREAVIPAAKLCEQFAENIHTKYIPYASLISQSGVLLPQWSLRDFKFERTSFDDWPAVEEWIESLRLRDLRNHAVDHLNSMEAFAAYFAKGAADEEIAFQMVGPPFCAYVHRYAPVLFDLLSEEHSGRFHNTIKLFETWQSRINRTRLEVEQSKIESKMDGIHVPVLPIIGKSGDLYKK